MSFCPSAPAGLLGLPIICFCCFSLPAQLLFSFSVGVRLSDPFTSVRIKILTRFTTSVSGWDFYFGIFFTKFPWLLLFSCLLLFVIIIVCLFGWLYSLFWFGMNPHTHSYTSRCSNETRSLTSSLTHALTHTETHVSKETRLDITNTQSKNVRTFKGIKNYEI